jgi:hypothetical protein
MFEIFLSLTSSDLNLFSVFCRLLGRLTFSFLGRETTLRLYSYSQGVVKDLENSQIIGILQFVLVGCDSNAFQLPESLDLCLLACQAPVSAEI